MNYTKGEWKAKLERDLIGWQIYANITDIALVLSPVNNDAEIKEIAANANLIAAAPELYEALKALSTEYQGTEDIEYGSPYYHQWQAAIKAIAKAEGE